MEDRISKAIEDIDSIRNMMEESRVDHLGLAKLSVVYGLWAILGIILPVMFMGSNVLRSAFATRFNVKSTFDEMGLPVNVLLFSAFLLVCAYVTEKKKLIYISAVILFAYIMLSTVWWDRGPQAAGY